MLRRAITIAAAAACDLPAPRRHSMVRSSPRLNSAAFVCRARAFFAFFSAAISRSRRSNCAAKASRVGFMAREYHQHPHPATLPPRSAAMVEIARETSRDERLRPSEQRALNRCHVPSIAARLVSFGRELVRDRAVRSARSLQLAHAYECTLFLLVGH